MLFRSPAQIVWRRGLEVISISAPIGIQCLTKEAAKRGWGKLQDLITEVRAITNRPVDDRTADPSTNGNSINHHAQETIELLDRTVTSALHEPEVTTPIAAAAPLY